MQRASERQRRSGPAAIGVASLALVIGIAGCSSSVSSSAGPSAAPAPTAAPLTGKYVALGSSFAAGPGISPVDDRTCARSTMNYPHQVAAQLGLQLVDVSCSSATTANFDGPQGSVPPQLDAVTPDTALVTIAMGGTDIGYSGSSLACYPLAQKGQACHLPTPDATAQSAATMTDSLAAAIGKVQQKAPNARIFVVGYLDVYPDPARSCEPDNPISDDDSTTIGNMGKVLNDAMRAAADRGHVPFIDAYAASKGHDICSGRNTRWVEGAVVENPGFTYHPNAAGMTEYTKLVTDAVRGGG
jgi:hypothetical protein